MNKRIFMGACGLVLASSGLAALSANEVHVYYGTEGRASGAEGIYHSTLDLENGRLGPVSLAAEVEAPGFMAWSPHKSYLYSVVNRGDKPAVAAFKVTASGELKLLNESLMEAGKGAHIAVHPSGGFLITAHYGTGRVSVFPLGHDGHVEPCAQIIQHEGGSGVYEKRQDSPHPHWGGFSPDGTYAFVPDLGLDQIVIYAVNEESTGLTRIGAAESIPGGGPRHMRFSVDGRFIYLLNELALSVSTFAYGASDASVTRLTTVAALPEVSKAKELFNSGSEILVHPGGTFVYSANRGHDSVTAYKADRESGELSVIEVEPIRGAWPRNIQMDGSGNWLLAAGADSNTVSVFRIDQDTGELQFQLKSSRNVPAPICILIQD